jgi:hypothetical protein
VDTPFYVDGYVPKLAPFFRDYVYFLVYLTTFFDLYTLHNIERDDDLAFA